VDHPEEQHDVRQAQAGNRESFAALVDRYWPRIYRWLYGLTRCSHTAEDLTQEVFLKAWVALPALQSGSTFRPWLFRIARNALADSQRASPAVLLRPLPEALAAGPSPFEVAVGREGQALLHDACARLPFHFRSALLLWTQEGLSYGEISQALDVTEETARWRVCRARKLLLKALGSYLDKKAP
jgi:RNA polymerase sigma-70 factor (ECF subfamily)